MTLAKLRKNIQFAVRWWAERMDGSVDGLVLPDEVMYRYQLLKKLYGWENDPEFNEEEELIGISAKYRKETALGQSTITPRQRVMFEHVLAQKIYETVKSRGVALLHFDRVEGVDPILGMVAEECGIAKDTTSPFAFTEYVDMFIGEDVEVRYSDAQNLIILPVPQSVVNEKQQ